MFRSEFSQILLEASRDNYGVALSFFVKKLVQLDRVQLRKRVQAFVGDFVGKYCPQDASGQVIRVCQRFGLVAAAGSLAKEFRVVPWGKNEAEQAAAKCFAVWLDLRDNPTVPHEILTGLAQIRQYLEQYGESRFGKVGATSTSTISSRAGFKEVNANGTYDYLVLPEVFTKLVCMGFYPKVLCEVMANNGWLVKGNDGKNSTLKHVPGMDTKRVYYIKAPVDVRDLAK